MEINSNGLDKREGSVLYDIATEINNDRRSVTDYSTKELHEELTKREGLSEISVGLENTLTIRDKIGTVAHIIGPARILINRD